MTLQENNKSCKKMLQEKKLNVTGILFAAIRCKRFTILSKSLRHGESG
jgi:hypothetical protein